MLKWWVKFSTRHWLRFDACVLAGIMSHLSHFIVRVACPEIYTTTTLLHPTYVDAS